MKKIFPVCKHCGSDNVIIGAAAHWETENQEWMVSTVYDDEHCITCGGETKLVWEKFRRAKRAKV